MEALERRLLARYHQGPPEAGAPDAGPDDARGRPPS